MICRPCQKSGRKAKSKQNSGGKGAYMRQSAFTEIICGNAWKLTEFLTQILGFAAFLYGGTLFVVRVEGHEKELGGNLPTQLY